MVPASIYVAIAPSRGTKIGYSKQPTVRLGQIASELGEPVALEYSSAPHVDAQAVEALAHWLLRERHRGAEWFDVDVPAAVAVIREAVRLVDCGERAPQNINNATPYADLKTVRIQLVIAASEVEALDHWRAARQIWSRSEAIRRLIAEGVKSPPTSKEPRQ